MRVELIEPSDSRWRALLARVAHTAYVLPGYAAACAALEAGRVLGLYFGAPDGAALIPLIIRRLPALGDAALDGWSDATSPYGYPGALVAGALPLDELRSVMERLLASHRILTVFLRPNPFTADANRVLEWMGAKAPGGDTVFLDLRKGEHALWMGARSEHRREILQLKSQGYTARVDDWSHWPAFIALYQATMERVEARAFYFFDRHHFERLRSELGAWLHLVSVVGPEGEVASAGLYLTGSDRAVHAYLTGTVSSALGATKVLHDAAWRWAAAQGHQSFHLGGGLGRENDRLLFFKKGFSRTLLPYFTVRVVSDDGVYRRACAAAGNPDSTYFPAYRDPAAGHRPTQSHDR